MLDPKCIYRKSIFEKCTRLACLLSFASLFICHKCDGLTSFYNAKDINIKEMGQCMHSKLSSILFPNMVITDLDKGSLPKKNRFFLGNSPKQRNPPTHRYGLGLIEKER